MIGDRVVWEPGDDLLQWTSGSAGRRGQVDGWLVTCGLPPGRELQFGSLVIVRSLFGRYRVQARLHDGRTVRAPLRLRPPAGLWGRRAATGGAARRTTQRTRI